MRYMFQTLDGYGPGRTAAEAALIDELQRACARFNHQRPLWTYFICLAKTICFASLHEMEVHAADAGLTPKEVACCRAHVLDPQRVLFVIEPPWRDNAVARMLYEWSGQNRPGACVTASLHESDILCS